MLAPYLRYLGFIWVLSASATQGTQPAEDLSQSLHLSNHFLFESIENARSVGLVEQDLAKRSMETLWEEEASLDLAFSLLKLGNYYLNNENPAKALYYYYYTRLCCGDPDPLNPFPPQEGLLKAMAEKDEQLPAIFTSVLYNQARASWYSYQDIKIRNHGYQLCQASLQWVRALTKQGLPSLPMDPSHEQLDSETLYRLFLARIYVEKGQFTEARQVLDRCQVLASPVLVLQKNKCEFFLAVDEASVCRIPKRKEALFSRAQNFLRALLEDLETSPQLTRQALLLAYVADFYADFQSPDFDLSLAESYYTLAQELAPAHMQWLHSRLAEGRSRLEQKKARVFLSTYQLQQSQGILSTGLLGKEVARLGFEQLAQVRQSQGQTFQATLSYAHAQTLVSGGSQEFDKVEQRFAAVEADILDRYPVRGVPLEAFELRIAKYRAGLRAIRFKADAWINLGLTYTDISNRVSHELASFLSMMLKDSLEGVGIHSEDIALITWGSVARGTATPFSDIECAILTTALPDTELFARCQALSELMTLYTTALGGTPSRLLEGVHVALDLRCPAAYRIDEALIFWMQKNGKIPVLSLNRDMQVPYFEGDRGALSLLASSRLLLGSSSIYEDFTSRCSRKREMSDLLIFDGARLKPPFVKWHRAGPEFILKLSVYRPFHTLLDGLSMQHDLLDLEPLKQIAGLEKAQVFTVVEADSVRQLLEAVCQLRLTRYAQSGGQEEGLESMSPGIIQGLEFLYQKLCQGHGQNPGEPRKEESFLSPALQFIREARALLSIGEQAGAEEAFNQALEILENYFPYKNLLLADVYFELGRLAEQSDRHLLAYSRLEKSLKIYDRVHGTHHPSSLPVHGLLRRLALRNGDTKLAMEHLDHCEEVLSLQSRYQKERRLVNADAPQSF